MARVAKSVLLWFKSMYLHITLTKTTLAFFLASFAHCFAQALVQSLLFSLDSDANALTSAIVATADVPRGEFAWLTRQRNESTHDTAYTLRLCDAVPYEKSPEGNPCVIVFQSNEADTFEVPSGFRKREHVAFVQSNSAGSNLTHFSSDSSSSDPPGNLVPGIAAFVRPVLDTASGNISGVELTKADVKNGQPTFLDAQCTRVLLYADQVLKNWKREELSLIGSEFWLLGISVFAIMYISTPHLYAGLAFRVLSVGWSAYSLWRTHDIDERFDVLLNEGACGVELFPMYFRMRIAVQIPELALNILALVTLIYLVTSLVQAYTTHMFQCVGHVMRIYRFLLGLFTCLQLSVYLIIACGGIWIDQLITGAFSSISSHTTAYACLFAITLALFLLWLAVGWRSVRLEQPRALLVFLGLGVLFEAGWAVMYDSLVWRWTWIQWPFFASLTVAAQLVILASIVLGVVCRANFGKGLKEYMHVTSVLKNEEFESGVFEHTLSQTGKGCWGTDIEKQRKVVRLSQTLDFGAHQPPPPPMSPSPYDAPDSVLPAAPSQIVTNPVSRVDPLSRVSISAPPAHPSRFSVVLPTLPRLGKNDPWKSAEKMEGEDDFGGARF